MARVLKKLPSQYLAGISPEASKGFKKLRETVLESGPLDHETCEQIVVAGFAICGFEDAFKNHGGHLLRAGTSVEKIRHAVLETSRRRRDIPVLRDAVFASVAWRPDLDSMQRGNKKCRSHEIRRAEQR